MSQPGEAAGKKKKKKILTAKHIFITMEERRRGQQEGFERGRRVAGNGKLRGIEAQSRRGPEDGFVGKLGIRFTDPRL